MNLRSYMHINVTLIKSSVINHFKIVFLKLGFIEDN